MRPSWKLRLLISVTFLLAMTGLTGPAIAGIEHKSLKKIDLTGQPLDITNSFDGKLVFVLTPGTILVYSAVENTIIDRIAVEKIYTRISYADKEKLILSAADPATLEIVKFDQIYNINIVNRPFRGPREAKVTLVVFDDYQ